MPPRRALSRSELRKRHADNTLAQIRAYIARRSGGAEINANLVMGITWQMHRLNEPLRRLMPELCPPRRQFEIDGLRECEEWYVYEKARAARLNPDRPDIGDLLDEMLFDVLSGWTSLPTSAQSTWSRPF